MSAFQCDDSHISALAGYAAKHGLSYIPGSGREHDAALIGKMLHAANVASMFARYEGRHGTDPNDAPPFVFNASAAARALHCPPIAIIKAAQCFEYQACEVNDWTETVAARCIASIIANAIHDLPGYNDAAWGSPLPAVSAVRKVA